MRAISKSMTEVDSQSKFMGTSFRMGGNCNIPARVLPDRGDKQQTIAMFHKQKISSKEGINLNLMFVSRQFVRRVIQKLGSVFCLDKMIFCPHQKFLSRTFKV